MFRLLARVRAATGTGDGTPANRGQGSLATWWGSTTSPRNTIRKFSGRVSPIESVMSWLEQGSTYRSVQAYRVYLNTGTNDAARERGDASFASDSMVLPGSGRSAYRYPVGRYSSKRKTLAAAFSNHLLLVPHSLVAAAAAISSSVVGQPSAMHYPCRCCLPLLLHLSPATPLPHLLPTIPYRSPRHPQPSPLPPLLPLLPRSSSITIGPLLVKHHSGATTLLLHTRRALLTTSLPPPLAASTLLTFFPLFLLPATRPKAAAHPPPFNSTVAAAASSQHPLPLLAATTFLLLNRSLTCHAVASLPHQPHAAPSLALLCHRRSPRWTLFLIFLPSPTSIADVVVSNPLPPATHPSSLASARHRRLQHSSSAALLVAAAFLLNRSRSRTLLCFHQPPAAISRRSTAASSDLVAASNDLSLHNVSSNDLTPAAHRCHICSLIFHGNLPVATLPPASPLLSAAQPRRRRPHQPPATLAATARSPQPLLLPSLLPASRARRNINAATLSHHLVIATAINLKIAAAPAHPLSVTATIFLFSHPSLPQVPTSFAATPNTILLMRWLWMMH
ncbi:hypothetical protein BHM03_00002690 [Ensete ventricosum]|nr:hypothetical protein BHM03_00002690 [Ensete ventricosum]